MDETAIPSFAVWAGITGIIMLITGFSYRAVKKKNSV